MADDSRISRITVSRIIDAPAPEIFDVLTLPARHREIDGSGFVVSDDRTDPITAVGQEFRMNMTGEHMAGDYQTENHVTGYDKNRLVSWRTAPAGTEPPGWERMSELEADGLDSTEVTLTYDWDKVTDKALLQKVSFPLVSQDQLEDALANRAAAVAS